MSSIDIPDYVRVELSIQPKERYLSLLRVERGRVRQCVGIQTLATQMLRSTCAKKLLPMSTI